MRVWAGILSNEERWAVDRLRETNAMIDDWDVSDFYIEETDTAYHATEAA